VIEALGSTSLVKVGNNFYFDTISHGVGPELQSAGVAVDATHTNGWVPIGAVQTASGYELAWKLTGADQYTVWATDSSGNYSSSPLVAVSGSNAALQALETSFHEDLNGDGTIGIPSPTSPATLVLGGASSDTATVKPTSDPSSVDESAGQGAGIGFGDLVHARQDSFAFTPNLGPVMVNFDPPKDTIQFGSSILANIADLLAALHDDAHGHAAPTVAAHDTLTIQNVTAAELLAHQTGFDFV